MLELSRRLTDRSLAAVADLERRVPAVDGGRLKLEWPTLCSRAGDRVEDLMWWKVERLVGFLGPIWVGGVALRSPTMVDPAARRGGIANALFNAAVPLCRERVASSVLLVVPGGSTAGQAFARHRGGTLEHSEHAMRLDAKPSVGRSDPRLRLRAATRGDAAAVARLLERGFGHRPADPKDMTDPAARAPCWPNSTGYRLPPYGWSGTGPGGVYGFAVDPAWRGKGIGRDMLCRVCALLLAEGAQSVALEVAVDNARALGLYTSVGFRATAVEDYYAVALTS